MMNLQQNGNGSQVTTDPDEALRTPQVQASPCGNTVVHTCITGGSSGSNVAFDPMYINPAHGPQTLFDIEARNRARSMHQQHQQPSACSCIHNPLSLAACLEADAARSDSSHLSHTSPPTLPPPTQQGPMPSVPNPPRSSNTQHRRNARVGKGRDGEGNDPLFESDPWFRAQRNLAEEERTKQERIEQAWKTQQSAQTAWEQYRTPVNSGTQHEPHPDHAHSRTPKFSPCKPLNTNERAAWAGNDTVPSFPEFPRPNPVPTHAFDDNPNPFAQTFMHPTFTSHLQPQTFMHPTFTSNPQPLTFPALHPQSPWTQQCIPQPHRGKGKGQDGIQGMQEHIQRFAGALGD